MEQWIWALSIGGLLIVLTASSAWKLVPCFTLLLITSVAQAIAHPSNMDFTGSWWISWNKVLTGLKVLTAIEVFYVRTKAISHRAAWLVLISSMCFGATYCFARVDTGQPWVEATVVMKQFQATLVAFLIIVALIPLLVDSTLTPMIHFHTWILIALFTNSLVALATQEPLLPNISLEDWKVIMRQSYLGASICYLTWSVVTLRFYDSAGQSSNSSLHSHALD